jgi:hypothetical protein
MARPTAPGREEHGMTWVTVFGSTVSAPIRKRGPEYQERYIPARWAMPVWRIRAYEQRAGAWYVTGTRPATGPGDGRHGRPAGVIVSQSDGPRQIELSHRMGRAYIAADPEGYSR